MPERPYRFGELFALVLRPERRFYWLMFIYGVAISALTLSIPLSVQVLISTVANAALVRQVVVLGLILSGLLCLSGLFTAIQYYLMELFERRFFSRVIGEVTLRLVYARLGHMQAINRDELVNRYFDVMTVHKSLPPLLTGALATVLQTAVGFAVTSFYHPFFLVFNLAVVVLAWLVFRAFDSGAAQSAHVLSERKYDAARWLEGLARSSAFFKSERTIDYALASTLAVRENYVTAHRRHFRYTFSQVVGFLLLYAASSAVLLGMGGWLVILGQLTIGQLVAAELILSAIFFGLTRIGYYLELYYDLYAALVKLTQLFDLPVEAVRRDSRVGDWTPDVRFERVAHPLPGGEFRVDVEFPAGSHSLVATRSSKQVRAFTDLLLAFDRAASGRVVLGGHDVEDFNVHRLRDAVHVVDSTLLPECSIAEFLAIADPALTRAQMRQLLAAVGLDTEAAGVDLDRTLTPYGYPLSEVGVIKLKIAFALASHPKVLVLTPLFDMLSHEARESVVVYLREHRETTLLCFSHRQDQPAFDRYLLCDFDRQVAFDDEAALGAAFDAAVSEDVPTPTPTAAVEA